MKVFPIFVLGVVILSCIFTIEAKKHKDEKVKADKIKEKISHKHVKSQPDHPNTVATHNSETHIENTVIMSALSITTDTL
jgi:hypothetical protein